jgi:hypothetical protein
LAGLRCAIDAIWSATGSGATSFALAKAAAELLAKSISVGDIYCLHLFELDESRFGVGRVLTATFEREEDFTLTNQIALTGSNVLLSHRQVTRNNGAIHAVTIPRLAISN